MVGDNFSAQPFRSQAGERINQLLIKVSNISKRPIPFFVPRRYCTVQGFLDSVPYSLPSHLQDTTTFLTLYHTSYVATCTTVDGLHLCSYLVLLFNLFRRVEPRFVSITSGRNRSLGCINERLTCAVLWAISQHDGADSL